MSNSDSHTEPAMTTPTLDGSYSIAFRVPLPLAQFNMSTATCVPKYACQPMPHPSPVSG
jgi:hypothetical protein